MSEGNFEREPVNLPEARPEEITAAEAPLVARVADKALRWTRIFDDPRIREGAKAAARTVANFGIGIADFFPGVGDSISWAADALKISERTDVLTPDVSAKAAWMSEAAEVFVGVVPTHLFVEFPAQLKADWPRMKEGLKALTELRRAEVKDYQENQEAIDVASREFLEAETT